jgi:hypothetical protein
MRDLRLRKCPIAMSTTAVSTPAINTTVAGTPVASAPVVAPLSPSLKKVVEALGMYGEMTHKDLVIKTRLNPRTVRFALKKLKERKFLIEKLNISDARQIIYRYRPAWVPEFLTMNR